MPLLTKKRVSLLDDPPAAPPSSTPPSSIDRRHFSRNIASRYDSPHLSAPIRVLIVDDHPIVRLGLSAVLDIYADIAIAGTASGGREALALLPQLRVDIILLDLRMPGFSGIETLNQLRTIAPHIRTIILSSFECDEEIYAAVQAGAQGYLHKEARAQEIVAAIHLVHNGGRAFPRRIAERLSGDSMTAGLSQREREILGLVATGLTNKEVANTLQISQFTVRNHLNHITEKLQVTDRTEAIFMAIQTGILTV
jgi:DNA-binding NarL/FixJ family response regulator